MQGAGELDAGCDAPVASKQELLPIPGLWCKAAACLKSFLSHTAGAGELGAGCDAPAAFEQELLRQPQPAGQAGCKAAAATQAAGCRRHLAGKSLRRMTVAAASWLHLVHGYITSKRRMTAELVAHASDNCRPRIYFPAQHILKVCQLRLQGEVDQAGWHKGLAQLRERGGGPIFSFPHGELQVTLCHFSHTRSPQKTLASIVALLQAVTIGTSTILRIRMRSLSTYIFVHSFV